MHSSRVLSFTLALTFALCLGLGLASERVFERFEQLHEDYYSVRWIVDLDGENVTFVVTAKTLGYIGFGISPQGGMSQADIVIGGVDDQNKPYFTDRFGTGKFEPKIDDSQDWHLINATQDTTHTKLTFTRKFDTCDPEDLPILNDTTKLIFSWGVSDNIEHHAEKGAQSVNLLDPIEPTMDVSEFDVWHLKLNTKLPSTDTTYWCTMHKTPNYSSPVQIVGFKVNLDAPQARDFNHHLSVSKCTKTPEEGLVDMTEKPGGLCFEDDQTGMDQVSKDCQLVFYVWAKGGMPFFLPEDVGFPLNEGGKQEYWMVEMHYDNPQMLADVQYETGVEIYTTNKLRKHEAGVIAVEHAADYSLIIPPASTKFVTVGHCSPECTESRLPAEGVNVFNVLLHSHLAGRALTLRQFRGDEELAYPAYDNNYDFNYQQNRPLAFKIMPKDHLTFECTYANAERNPAVVTLGGLTTRHEMCTAFLTYYPRVQTLLRCTSHRSVPNIMAILGVTEIDASYETQVGGDPMVLAPDSMKGKNWTTVLNSFNWTDAFRAEFAEAAQFGVHESVCAGEAEVGVTMNTTYPEGFKPYVPPASSCNIVTSATEGVTGSTSPPVTETTTEGGASSILPVTGKWLVILLSACLLSIHI